MQLSDFTYHLPPELIAQTPAEPRDSSRLLHVKKDGALSDQVFRDIADMLSSGDVLVINNTKVIKARLKWKIVDDQNEACKECEIFLHMDHGNGVWDCLVYPGKKLKPGKKVIFLDSENTEVMHAEIQSISEKWRIVQFSQSGQDFLDSVERIGSTPLPPYIKDTSSDDNRYQTVYHDSEKSGSVAAPTAWLHFTPELIDTLKEKWIIFEEVTLHVGLGTFANVEIDDITQHHMHSEKIEILPKVAKRLNDYKSQGKRIIAVGTTSVRTLESFSGDDGVLRSGTTNTEIFIYPGYEWKFVDAIITNFHLPESTLLMLVSSFSGYDTIQKAYEHATRNKYRFFSFWDAMFLE